MKEPLVSIIMGSNSDYSVMKEAAHILNEFEIPFEINIVSAHRTPGRMFEFANEVHKRGLKVIIAGAGGAAHLPGMVASISPLLVIGVPIKSSNSLDGWDSLLSIVQMPGGVPVATVAVNGSKNAGILAIQILALSDTDLQKKFHRYKESLKDNVVKQSAEMQRNLTFNNDSI